MPSNRDPPPVPSAQGGGQSDLLQGRWRLLRQLGRGGMCTVLLAHDVALDRDVAIKALLPGPGAMDDLVARFEREARLLAKLEHPNIVVIHHVGRSGKLPFIVMKYIKGDTVRALIESRRAPLPRKQVLSILEQVCAGLGFIHQNGCIHRDIKPANIIVGSDGHATILDFGVAREGSSELTNSRMALGTPHYMAPEMFLRPREVDFRGDLYALGVMTFEMLTGQHPFAGPEGNVVKAHLTAAPPAASSLDPALGSRVDEFMSHALAKEPAARHQTAASFFDELSEALSKSEPQAETQSPFVNTVIARPTRPPIETPIATPATPMQSMPLAGVRQPVRTATAATAEMLGPFRLRVVGGLLGVCALVGIVTGVIIGLRSNERSPRIATPIARPTPPPRLEQQVPLAPAIAPPATEAAPVQQPTAPPMAAPTPQAAATQQTAILPPDPPAQPGLPTRNLEEHSLPAASVPQRRRLAPAARENSPSPSPSAPNASPTTASKPSTPDDVPALQITRLEEQVSALRGLQGPKRAATLYRLRQEVEAWERDLGHRSAGAREILAAGLQQCNDNTECDGALDHLDRNPALAKKAMTWLRMQKEVEEASTEDQRRRTEDNLLDMEHELRRIHFLPQGDSIAPPEPDNP
jgi:eukaryotic-like serine/threonine-protein kinase